MPLCFPCLNKHLIRERWREMLILNLYLKTCSGEREREKERQGSGWIFLQGYKKNKSKDTNQENYLSSYLNSYFNVKSRNNWPSRKTHVCIKRKIYRPMQLKEKQSKNNREEWEQLQKCTEFGNTLWKGLFVSWDPSCNLPDKKVANMKQSNVSVHLTTDCDHPCGPRQAI